VLIAFGLWIGWRRFGLIALGTFAFLHLAPSALYPEWVVEYWQRALPGFVNDLSPVYNIAPLSLIRYLPAEIGGVARAIALAAAVLVFAAPFVLAIRAPGSQRIHLVALVMAAAVVGAPVVESYHLVSVLLPLWVLVSTLRLAGSRIQLITLGATLLLLSQPFHIAQLLSYVTRVPPEVLGGMVLELGAIALFVVLLYNVTRARNGHLRAHAR
jgi:hypothetical protein